MSGAVEPASRESLFPAEPVLCCVAWVDRRERGIDFAQSTRKAREDIEPHEPSLSLRPHFDVSHPCRSQSSPCFELARCRHRTAADELPAASLPQTIEFERLSGAEIATPPGILDSTADAYAPNFPDMDSALPGKTAKTRIFYCSAFFLTWQMRSGRAGGRPTLPGCKAT